jgi:hypothetical protein
MGESVEKARPFSRHHSSFETFAVKPLPDEPLPKASAASYGAPEHSDGGAAIGHPLRCVTDVFERDYGGDIALGRFLKPKRLGTTRFTGLGRWHITLPLEAERAGLGQNIYFARFIGENFRETSRRPN